MLQKSIKKLLRQSDPFIVELESGLFAIQTKPSYQSTKTWERVELEPITLVKFRLTNDPEEADTHFSVLNEHDFSTETKYVVFVT